jgi:tripartite-type tricarboxylate transporter receptor subunit TctC
VLNVNTLRNSKACVMHRRTLLRSAPPLALAAAGAGTAAPRRAAAQEARTVRLIVPYAPGGAIDAIGRVFAPRLGPLLGEAWVVDNRSGGNGVIGAQEVARAAPDGRTLMFSADIHLVARHVMRNVPYDPVADFTPVARAAQGPLVLVGNPGLRPRTLAELIADAKARPDEYTFANSSLGAMGHLATESFKRLVGVDLLVVSYRGTAPALNDVVSGQVPLMMAPLLSVLEQVRVGRLRAYAVTAAERSRVAPGIPTAAEAGLPGLEFTVWYAMWGPKGLPSEMAERLNGAVRRVAAMPEVATRLAEFGVEAVAEDPAAFVRHIQAEYARNTRIIAEAGIQPM